MTKLTFSGFELGEVASGTEFGGHNGTVTVVSTGQRSGNHAAQITAASSWVATGVGGSVSTTFFLRTYVNMSANPTAQIGVMGLATGNTAAATLGEIYLETNGTLTLRLNNGTALATSAPIALGAYVMVELGVAYPASGASTLTLRWAGMTVGTGTGSATVHTSCAFGNFRAAAVGATMLLDDISVNNSAGTSNNSWCGPGAVIALWPVSDSSRTGFTAGAGGTTSLFDAVNNHPPTGLASGSATNGSQIKDATSNTTDNYVANMGAYTDSIASGGGGMGDSDSVRALALLALIGNSTATARTLGITGVTNPAIAEGTDTTSGTAGTYPNGWTDIGSNIIQVPTVTLSSKPTVKIRKGTATTDAVQCCAFFVTVDYTPAQTSALMLVGVGP